MSIMDTIRPMALTRRRLLQTSLGGFGGLALAGIAARRAAAESTGGQPGLPHHAPKARRAVMLFLGGAPSHVDLWDEKPELSARHDQAPPADAPSNGFSFGLENARLLRPIAPFHRCGQSG